MGCIVTIYDIYITLMCGFSLQLHRKVTNFYIFLQKKKNSKLFNSKVNCYYFSSCKYLIIKLFEPNKYTFIIVTFWNNFFFFWKNVDSHFFLLLRCLWINFCRVIWVITGKLLLFWKVHRYRLGYIYIVPILPGVQTYENTRLVTTAAPHNKCVSMFQIVCHCEKNAQ